MGAGRPLGAGGTARTNPWHVPYQELVLPVRALARHVDLLHGLANLVPFASPGFFFFFFFFFFLLPLFLAQLYCCSRGARSRVAYLPLGSGTIRISAGRLPAVRA